MEARLVGSGEFDAELYCTITNSLGRALSRIGLQRRSRDITPAVPEKIDGKALEELTVQELAALYRDI